MSSRPLHSVLQNKEMPRGLLTWNTTINLTLGRVAVVSSEVSITCGVSIVPCGDGIALFGVANQVWHGKRDTRL